MSRPSSSNNSFGVIWLALVILSNDSSEQSVDMRAGRRTFSYFLVEGHGELHDSLATAEAASLLAV